MKPRYGAADLLAKHAGQNARPVTVTFQVTDRCNYRCVHCYQQHTDKTELSLAEIERILTELADMGVMFVTLMGGEFFMRRDADEILRIAHELQFVLRLKTTGHHIHDRRADWIAQMRPILVEMSMYAATPHLHEGVTKQAGSWNRTYEAAKRLIQRKVPVQINAPVLQSTANDVEHLAQLAKDLGAECSFDAKVTGMENRDQQPVRLRMDWGTLKNFYRSGAGGIGGYLENRFGGNTAEINRTTDNVCRAGQIVGINPQGQVWPCNTLPIPCGDLRKQSFQEIWFGSKDLKAVRELRYADISECNICPVRKYCQRCHAMALLEQGDLQGPSLEACRHAVATRDSLRERGLIVSTDTALPPTWHRVDLAGQHHASKGVRPRALRVVA